MLEQITTTTKAVRVGFQGVHHLVFITPDMDRTVRFYRDVLGLPLIATLSEGQPDEFSFMRHYFFQLGELDTLAFFEWPNQEVNTGPAKPAGVPSSGRQFDHLALRVKNLEELAALQQQLAGDGIEVTGLIYHNNTPSIYFNDPHGIALEASCWMIEASQGPFLFDPYPVPAVNDRS